MLILKWFETPDSYGISRTDAIQTILEFTLEFFQWLIHEHNVAASQRRHHRVVRHLEVIQGGPIRQFIVSTDGGLKIDRSQLLRSSQT